MVKGPAMIGITGFGTHIPYYRLSGQTLAAVWGGAGGGERAVANHDEDSLTMAVEASLSALAGHEPGRLGGVVLATTTPPYAEKSSAAILAAVVDAPRDLFVADLGGSLRAGTTGLRLALDAVRAGSAGQVLVAAADIRSAPPGGDLEPFLGDGAAAVVVGDGDGVLARFEGAYSLTHEFSDVWRKADARFPEQGDLTFVRAYGYEKLIPEAVHALLGQLGLKPQDVAKVACYAPDARLAPGILRSLRFPDSVSLRMPLLAAIGNTGAAAPLLALAAALEEAQPGERVLVVGYGSGADALLFQATERLEGWERGRGVTAQLRAGRPLAHYGRFLQFRRLVESEVIRAFTGLPVMQREERQDLRLYGQRCAACGAVQYPRRHLCWRCSGKDLGEHRLSRRGRVFTFTRDHLVPSPDPPTVMVAADLEGGGRFYTQMTDCDPAAVTFEMPVELTFRRFHEGGELVNYFWKFRPVLGG
ncbi:MAG TPA: OB-fold domain-containing protein [Methylomirabilota bacterium]|jgi:3-hydroxy-3-methylglutaryl CoA synthase|nr:OB-fold domain-containing protein [Methylomirabilota bacterium]